MVVAVVEGLKMDWGRKRDSISGAFSLSRKRTNNIHLGALPSYFKGVYSQTKSDKSNGNSFNLLVVDIVAFPKEKKENSYHTYSWPRDGPFRRTQLKRPLAKEI